MNKLLLLALLISLPLYAEDTATTDEVIDVSTESAEPVATSEVVPETEPAPVITEEPKEQKFLQSDVVPENSLENLPPEEPAKTAEERQVRNHENPLITSAYPAEVKPFNHRKSHFLTTFGFEGMKYETPYEFTGVKSSFKPGDQELWGGRLGFGGQIHLFGGLFTTTKVEGYYMGTLFSKVLNGGSKDSDVKFAYTKKTGQIYGGDAVQQLGYIFDFRTKNPFMDEWAYLTFEPFIEAGVGFGQALNRLNYSYKLGTTDEAYRLTVEDQLVNTKIGAGFNLTSNQRFFLYARVTQNRYDITDRKASQYQKDNGGSGVTTKPTLSDKIDPITIYALGGGYKF